MTQRIKGSVRGGQVSAKLSTSGLQAEVDIVADDRYFVGVTVSRDKDTKAIISVGYTIFADDGVSVNIAAIETAIKTHTAADKDTDEAYALVVEQKASRLTLESLDARISVLES